MIRDIIKNEELTDYYFPGERDWAYLNHSLPDWSCYIRNEFLFNHKKGHGEVTKCDVHVCRKLLKREFHSLRRFLRMV